jgi:hypothetical protein
MGISRDLLGLAVWAAHHYRIKQVEARFSAVIAERVCYSG